MIDIIVERYEGDKQGPDIADSLISTEAQAVELGRVNIDENSSNRTIVTGSIPLRGYMEPGKLVQVTDLEKGTYIAMLSRFSISITRTVNGFSAISNVTLERNEEIHTE